MWIDGRLRELSLFTGIGGGLLGSMLLGWRTVAAVERDPYCVKLLCKRGGYVADAASIGGRENEPSPSQEEGQADAERDDGELPGRLGRLGNLFPIHTDIRTFHPVPGSCDIVTGGFPCQPHSQAGKRLGGKDDRDLWPDTLRVLRESHAPLGFFENVPGLLTSRDGDGGPMFGRILGDLAEAGFDAEWIVLGADDVGAPHRRKRLWILAVAHGGVERMHARAVGGTARGSGRDAAFDVLAGRREVPSRGADVADAASGRCQQRDAGLGPVPVADQNGAGLSPWWRDPADVGHADDPRPQGHWDDGERAGERAAGAAGAEPDAVSDAASGRPLGTVYGRVCGAGAEQAQPARTGLLDDIWQSLAPVGRVAHGIPARVDRLRGLGNAQVPQCMAAAFTLLAGEAGILDG